jgi:manganese/zinc/iron transport system permease protein
VAEWLAQLDNDTRSTFWIVGVGVLTNVTCAVLGCYLVLRRMSLLADALSHAVLPGLVVAFILAGGFNPLWMFMGAIVAGMLTTFLTQTVHRRGGVPADASMGVVFTSMFALGVILISRYGQGVDLDLDCILYGQIETVAIRTVDLWGVTIPRVLVTIVPVLLAVVAFVTIFWKELKLSSFDPALATTMGFNADLMHYMLMALVAVATVASFEQVGSVLVVAMFIVPGATAHLLTDRLNRMLWISAALAAAAAGVGYWAAVKLNVQAAGPMSVTIGCFFALAALFSPRYGVLSTLVRNLRMNVRIVREDLLAMLYRLEELAADRPLGAREATQALGGGLLVHYALWRLWQTKRIERRPDGLRLTEAGRRRAVQLVRSHRLWEAFLVQHLGLPADHVHGPAERMEHFIDEGLQQRIKADLEDVSLDPHGRDIPEEGPARSKVK